LATSVVRSRAKPARLLPASRSHLARHFTEQNVDAGVGSAQYTCCRRPDRIENAALHACLLASPGIQLGPARQQPRMADIYSPARTGWRRARAWVLDTTTFTDAAFAAKKCRRAVDPLRASQLPPLARVRARLYSWSTIRTNSGSRDNSSHGVLRLSLAAGSYRWEFVPVSGDARDAGSGTVPAVSRHLWCCWQRTIPADVGSAAGALTTAYGIWILPPPPRAGRRNPARPDRAATSDDAA